MIETLIDKKQKTNTHLIPADSRKLILSNLVIASHKDSGTLLEAEKFLWKNLQEAFPDELDSLNTSSVITFLKRRKIAVADLSSPENLLTAIAQSNIHEILFTDSFSAGSVFCRFYSEILEQQFTRTIRQQRGVLLDPSIFGRPIWLSVLYSAAGNANVGIARSQQFQAMRHLLDEDRPVHDFRIRTYREKFALPAEGVK